MLLPVHQGTEGVAHQAFGLCGVALLQHVQVQGAAQVAQLNVWFAAIAGGLLIGAGMLILFRHRASLGGLNVLVLYLQEARGWRAGYVQAGLDALILLSALFFVAPERIGLSLLGMVAINAALAINHRPGRYMAVS